MKFCMKPACRRACSTWSTASAPTRAGIDVAKRAAPTVKRVSQELGGKSPNVILEDADMTKAVTGGVMHMFNNSGQSCNAPSRMIVPLSKMKEVAAIAKVA